MADDPDDDTPFLVCIRAGEPSAWSATNVEADCVFCGQRVQHRPNVPQPVKPICYDCFKERDDAGEIDEIGVTLTSIQEWMQKKVH
jgi:hypothetical protein